MHPSKWRLCGKITHKYCIYTHVKHILNKTDFDYYNYGDLIFGTRLVDIIDKIYYA
jgi:hypothetical protein